MAPVQTDLPAALRRVAPALYALARARLGNEHDAQDAVQEASLRALRAQETYRPGAPLEHWIFRIAANVVKDMARRNRVRREAASHGPNADLFLEPAKAMEREEDIGRIHRCLGDLDAEERAPLLLHLVHGVPQAEVAELMDLSVEHLRVRLYRTIRKVRRALGIAE